MPKIYNVEQGTPEWEKLRIGIPTASEFNKIITAGGKKSTQWEDYAHHILAEEMLQRQIQKFQKTNAMLEGNERELESVQYYELCTGSTTERIGFITNDAGTVGYSPDRGIGEDGFLECKNPIHHTHIHYLLKDNLASDYWVQVQGGLWVGEREWCDLISYVPEMPELIVRVTRDEPYIKTMADYIGEFNERLAEKREKLIKAGHMQARAA